MLYCSAGCGAGLRPAPTTRFKMTSYLKDLECSRCNLRYPADQPQNLCTCGAPLFPRYDLPEVSRHVSRDDFSFRVHSLWRYKEVLPVRDIENIVSLCEGFTPLLTSVRLAK